MNLYEYLNSFNLQSLNEIFEMMKRDYEIELNYENKEEAVEGLLNILETNPDAFHDCVPAPMD